MRVAILWMTLALPAVSQAIEPFTCRAEAFSSYDRLAPGEIVAASAEPLRLRSDIEGCPELDDCATGEAVPAREKVLTAHPQEGWICVLYFAKPEARAGWLPEDDVEVLPFRAEPEPQDWLGSWISGLGSPWLGISARSDAGLELHFAFSKMVETAKGGTAMLHGQDRRIARLAEGRMQVRYGTDSTSCVIEFQLLGSFMISRDNARCSAGDAGLTQAWRRQQ